MARWALIKNGRVSTVTEHAAKPGINGQWLDVTGLQVGPGHRFDGSDFTPPAVDVSLTPRQFMRRFTAEEREQLEDQAASGTAPVKRKLAAFRFYLQIGGNVELADDYIVASVQAMEAAGVLDPGRAAQILAA